MKDRNEDPPMFMPRLFVRAFTLTLALALAGIIGADWLGEVSTAELAGTLICTPMVAYLLHLWAAPIDVDQ